MGEYFVVFYIVKNKSLLDVFLKEIGSVGRSVGGTSIASTLKQSIEHQACSRCLFIDGIYSVMDANKDAASTIRVDEGYGV